MRCNYAADPYGNGKAVNANYFKDCVVNPDGRVVSEFADEDNNLCVEQDGATFNSQFFLDKGIYFEDDFLDALNQYVLPKYKGIIEENLKEPTMFDISFKKSTKGCFYELNSNNLILYISVEPKYPSVSFIVDGDYAKVGTEPIADDVQFGKENYKFIDTAKYNTFKDFLKATGLLPLTEAIGEADYQTLLFKNSKDDKLYYISAYISYGTSEYEARNFDGFFDKMPTEHYYIEVELLPLAELSLTYCRFNPTDDIFTAGSAEKIKETKTELYDSTKEHGKITQIYFAQKGVFTWSEMVNEIIDVFNTYYKADFESLLKEEYKTQYKVILTDYNGTSLSAADYYSSHENWSTIGADNSGTDDDLHFYVKFEKIEPTA